MKNIVLIIAGLLAGAMAARPAEYNELTALAWAHYEAQDYALAAETYEKAFAAFDDKGYVNDRYNAACSWALAGNPDAAFRNLKRIAVKGGYSDLSHMLADTDLKSLHGDKRWEDLVETVRKNKEQQEKDYDIELVSLLDSIYETDQKYRREASAMSEKYGWDAPEMQEILDKMGKQDSLNLIAVTAILDERGWLGADVIGDKGNATLFLVIQHADLETQLKYLPMMQKAVEKGKARASSLALLEDRINLRQGKKQIYGSQIGTDPESGEYYVLPLENPDKVDERRAEVGLGPLAEYTRRFGFEWNPEEYQKKLPHYLELQKQ